MDDFNGHTSGTERISRQENIFLWGHPVPTNEQHLSGKQNTRYKPRESQVPLASNKKSASRSTGRSSGGNGSEVQEVVERLGLTRDGGTLGPKKEYRCTRLACDCIMLRLFFTHRKRQLASSLRELSSNHYVWKHSLRACDLAFAMSGNASLCLVVVLNSGHRIRNK